MNFFDEMEPEEPQAKKSSASMLPDIPEYQDCATTGQEKEVLGMYLSSHPLAEYAQQLKMFATHTSNTVKSCKQRQEVIVGGMINSIKLANTRNPKPGQPSKYANFDLEDMDGIGALHHVA